MKKAIAVILLILLISLISCSSDTSDSTPEYSPVGGCGVSSTQPIGDGVEFYYHLKVGGEQWQTKEPEL